MTTEPQAAAIAELVDWIEQQLRELREQDRESHTRVEMLQRQLHGLADQVVEGDRAIRSIRWFDERYSHLSRSAAISLAYTASESFP